MLIHRRGSRLALHFALGTRRGGGLGTREPLEQRFLRRDRLAEARPHEFRAPFLAHFPRLAVGLEVGPEPPQILNAFIEITPFDLVKYEVDKVSGYLRVDRPQRSSAQHPTLYGFVPRTYCDERVRRLAPSAKRGDGDPLDICVLSERAITRNEIIVPCRVIGGLQMIDGGEADDLFVMAFDAGDKRCNEPLRLAHLDHGDDRAILLEGGEGPARVKMTCCDMGELLR